MKAYSVDLRERTVRALVGGSSQAAVDNLSIPKSPDVRAAIKAVECQLLFLPPYSPDFAPIELAFAQIKAALRATAARTQEALDAAIRAALTAVGPATARNYFTHCGYSFAQ